MRRMVSITAGAPLDECLPVNFAVLQALGQHLVEHLDCQAFFNFMLDERSGRLKLNA